MIDIDTLVEAFENRAEELNIYLTKRIVTRLMEIMENPEIIPASRRDIIKMLENGRTFEQIKKDVKKAFPGMEKELEQAFKDASNEIEREQDMFVENAIVLQGITVTHHTPRTGVYVPTRDLYLTKTEKALLESAYRRTHGTLVNMTATTATQTQAVLIDTLDKAYNKVTHGVSLWTATSEAIDDYSRIGTWVDYNGHKQRLETAVVRAVRTGLSQASGDITLDRCNTLGIEQVLVSSHLGARYTDKDEPANHMSWQGKVYDYHKNGHLPNDRVGKELREIGKEVFPKTRNDSAGDFIKITGYGTGEGLCGWNCRHIFMPFYPGITVNNTVDYDSAENKRQYDLEQKQRAMERNLRNLRREYEGVKTAYKNSTGALKDTIKPRYQALEHRFRNSVQNYNAWCKQNGLRPKQERLKIS